MKFIPSLGEISQKATNAFARFPVTLIWAIIGTIFTIWYVYNLNFQESSFIGTWQSNATETEMGSVRNTITFTKNRFRLESFFSSSENPIVTEGEYEVIGPHLFAKKLNKGKPIPVEIGSEGDKLTLYISGEGSVKFVKKH